MDEIQGHIRRSIEHAGWMPGKRINAGGGGTVFACFPKIYLDLYESAMNHLRTQVQTFGAGTTEFAINIGNQFLSGLPSLGAVKIPHNVHEAGIDKRLTKEIQAMASFNHPNLIKLLRHDSGMPPNQV